MPMNLSELIQAAENNPELKAALRKITGSPEDLSALSEMTGRKITTPGSDFRNVMKNTDIPVNQEELFNPDVVRSPKVNPLPPVVREPNLPITRNEAGVPFTLQANETLPAASTPVESAMRDVTPPAPPSEPPPPAQLPSAAEDGGLSTGAKIGLGTAVGGATLLGLQGDTPTNNSSSEPQRKEASSEVVKEEPKAIAPSKEKTDDNDEEETDDSDVTPSQKAQPQAAEPDTETPASQKQEPTPNYLNFEGKGHDQNELDKLLQKQQDEIRNQRMQEAGALIGGAFARVKPDTSMYNERIKDTSLPVEQYKLKQANEANDPNSGLSQGMRDYMQKLGYPVSANSSAAHIQSVLPMISRDIEAKQAQAAKSADLAQRLKEQQIMAQAHIEAARQQKQGQQAMAQATHDLMRQDKQHQQQQQQANKMDQQAEQLRGNPAIQQDIRTLQRVQNAMSIIKQYPDPNQIPPNVINILNTDLATIASGGVPGEGLIHEVATPTVQSRIGSGLQQLLNRPTGANAAAFVKQNEGIFNTLAGDAQKRLEDRYQRIGNTLGHSVSPEDRENYRRTYLPNHTYDKNNDLIPTKQQAPAPMASDPRDQAAIKTIMQNNPGISIQDAAKALSNYKKSKAQ